MTDTLALAWQRLGLHDLLDLVTRDLGWTNWRTASNRLEGPCPEPGEKCAEDKRAGYLYPSAKGGPPHVYCRHRNSCGFDTSLFTLLAERLGSKRAAAELLKRRAGVESHSQVTQLPITHRAAWPQHPRLVVRRRSHD